MQRYGVEDFKGMCHYLFHFICNLLGAYMQQWAQVDAVNGADTLKRTPGALAFTES